MSWPTYPHEHRRPGYAGPAPLSHLGTGLGPSAAELGTLGLGARFNDDTWEDVVLRRGWERCSFAGVDGWVSPNVAGLRILFACPHLDVSGLDSSRLYVGFRPDDTDGDEVYAVRGGGDGEIIFDRLVHADGHFDRRAFLRWIDDDTMATLRPLL